MTDLAYQPDLDAFKRDEPGLAVNVLYTQAELESMARHPGLSIPAYYRPVAVCAGCGYHAEIHDSASRRCWGCVAMSENGLRRGV